MPVTLRKLAQAGTGIPLGTSKNLLKDENGEFEHSFTAELANNKNKDTNILAFDWKEAANSRDLAVQHMVMSNLGITAEEYGTLYPCINGVSLVCASVVRNTPEFNEFKHMVEVWESRIADRWVPNEQVDRQGRALAQQLFGLLSQPDSGNVSFFGSSLGAGVSVIAAEALVDAGVADHVERLTLLDAPEDGYAALTSGILHLDEDLNRIRQKSPSVAIDNYYSLVAGPAGGYGKAYKDAANIGTSGYAHTPVARDLYPLTIRYNQSMSYSYPENIPSNIGYDSNDNLVRLRTGTNCVVGPLAPEVVYGGVESSPFAGLDYCRAYGFVNVDDVAAKREEFRTILDFKAYPTTEGAQVEIDPETGLPTLFTGSPVFAFVDDLLINEDLVGVTFDFEWLSRFDDDSFRIWVNDTLVYTLDGLLARDGLLTTGLIDLSRWHSEEVRLTLGVISEFANSAVAVRDVRFTRVLSDVSDSTVPLPPTALLLLTGVAALRRRWKSTVSTCEAIPCSDHSAR
jgi:hypothetical protein